MTSLQNKHKSLIFRFYVCDTGIQYTAYFLFKCSPRDQILYDLSPLTPAKYPPQVIRSDSEH